MTCSCGTKICYICRIIITDYNHFDQATHRGAPADGRCPLYSHNDELHVRNVIAAGEKAKQELTKKGVNLKHDPTKVAPAATRGGMLHPMQDYYAQLQVPNARQHLLGQVAPAHFARAANLPLPLIPQQYVWQFPQVPQINLPRVQHVPQIPNMPQFNLPQVGVAHNGLPVNQELRLQFNFVVDDNQAGARRGANAGANAQARVQRAPAPRRRRQ